jgi:hypothetical protein
MPRHVGDGTLNQCVMVQALLHYVHVHTKAYGAWLRLVRQRRAGAQAAGSAPHALVCGHLPVVQTVACGACTLKGGNKPWCQHCKI